MKQIVWVIHPTFRKKPSKPLMTQQELYTKLEYIDHSRQKRSEMAAIIRNDVSLIKHLLGIIAQVNDPISCRASWILESVVRKDVSYLFTNLDAFTTLLEKVHLDSAVRPMAKICELNIMAYYSPMPNKSQQYLTNTHLERITTACFDWLIGNHKVAAKAYSMTSLCLLGRTFVWIHPELHLILKKDYSKGSAAYKARARMTLKKLKHHELK